MGGHRRVGTRTPINKLVRDRIPEIIRSLGRTCGVMELSPSEYAAALREKIIEEALEVRDATREHLCAELADLIEVIQALATQSGITLEALAVEVAARRAERGAFESRRKLLWVESCPE